MAHLNATIRTGSRLAFTLLLLLIAASNPWAQTPSVSKVKVNDVELSYIEKGTGEPLILLHGGVGDYRSWDAQFDEFARSYRVIAYSRRYSFPNRNAIVASYRPAISDAADLDALVGALGLKKVHLVGLSYGGLTGLIFAIDKPEKVLSMTLIEAPAHNVIRDLPGGEDLYRQFNNELAPVVEAFRSGDDRTALERFNRIMGRDLDKMPPAAARAILDNAPALRAINTASVAIPPVSKDKLRRLKIPALIISGEKTSMEIARRVDAELVRIMPNARKLVIANAGHAAPRENPADFNRGVLDFLASVSKGSRR